MFSVNVLSSCRQHSKYAVHRFRRSLTTEVIPNPGLPSPSDPSGQTKTSRPDLFAGVILNRSPILTRTPTLFERAYYAYQARIRRALHNPFPYDFYFKQGSLLETRFNIEERRRERRSFGPGFGVEEVVDEEKAAADKAAAEQLAQQESEGEEIMPRVHTTDTTQDYRSVDRKGQRNIYLLLLTRENNKDVWRFPQGGVTKGELLHQAAQRDLHAECGEYMDTWIVSRNPIAVYKPPLPETQLGEPLPERVTFFFKAHIMAGQVRPGEGIQDFAWLTKQEVEGRVEKDYWEGVKDTLSDF